MSLFMVVTNDGIRAGDGNAHGMSESAAEASAKARNHNAQRLGLKTTYRVVPFTRPNANLRKDAA